MQMTNLDGKITSFLQRKDAEFPELAVIGRQETRTIKYAQDLRVSGQLLFTR